MFFSRFRRFLAFSDVFGAFWKVLDIGEGTGRRAVSYTHLRAHETVLDLVCRLLLEKKINFFGFWQFLKNLRFLRFSRGLGRFLAFSDVFGAFWKVLDIGKGTGRRGYR